MAKPRIVYHPAPFPGPDGQPVTPPAVMLGDDVELAAAWMRDRLSLYGGTPLTEFSTEVIDDPIFAPTDLHVSVEAAAAAEAEADADAQATVEAASHGSAAEEVMAAEEDIADLDSLMADLDAIGAEDETEDR